MNTRQLILSSVLFIYCHCKQEFVYNEGAIGAGNVTRFELNAAVPMRIVLQTITGDADIYVSYKTTNVSYFLEAHDCSSATCGLDYVDIPSFPRPAYLAVYGHPSHPLSTWRVLVIPGKNTTYTQGEFEYPPEIIYEWLDDMESEEEWPAAGGLISVLIEILEIIITVLVS